MKHLLSLISTMCLIFSLYGCSYMGNNDLDSEEPNPLYAPYTYSSLEEFEKNEKNIKYYYIPSVNSDDYKLSTVTKRDDVYVMLEYDVSNSIRIKYDNLSEYDTERLQTLICRYSLYPDGTPALKETFINNGYTAIEYNGKTYYRWDEHAENNPDKQIIGYEIAFLQDGQLIFMHLPAVDSFEKMMEFTDLQKIEIN